MRILMIERHIPTVHHAPPAEAGAAGADGDFPSAIVWPDFYVAVARRLMDFRNDRPALLRHLVEMEKNVEALSQHIDKFEDGSRGPLRDICPFTFMGTFNRKMKDENRHEVAAELRRQLGISERPPTSFEGIPRLLGMKTWFFEWAKGRRDSDIDNLWDLFEAARAFSQSDSQESRSVFENAFDDALEVKHVGDRNITFGLFWSFPWNFPSLDEKSEGYMKEQLGVETPQLKPGKRKGGAGRLYLNLIDELKELFKKNDCPVNSFPELALKAGQGIAADEKEPQEPEDLTAESKRYFVSDIVDDGCFLPEEEIERFLVLLRTKKNLILQGPPGTGKTWLARRLAYALMEERASQRLRSVQFHPNLSYEDFVRGWRPSGDGNLKLADGPFMQAVESASKDQDRDYVVLIEEINRGNPSQIFGELLTLMEAGKRSKDDALELGYTDAEKGGAPVHVPDNLYVIGTMNLADRSLALVDTAFRRRFAFADLKPAIGPAWRRWVVDKRGVDEAVADGIISRMETLNARIRDAQGLGPHFCIGHSYVTPTEPLDPATSRRWFREVVRSEIRPLLEEYWFDAPKAASEAVEELLKGWRSEG